jgi:cysteine-rich repeat protein
VLGTDLGVNGSDGDYTADVQTYATSPAIDVAGYDNVRLQYRRWLTVEDGYYDTASIMANGMELWRNLLSEQEGGGFNHTDKEWRFHDVDLSYATVSGEVQLTFRLMSDPGLQLGGWNIDQLCVVAVVPTVCGDGKVTGLEACDDGPSNSDTQPDACRRNCQRAHCGDHVTDTGEECDDGNGTAGDGCEPECTRSTDVPPGDGGAEAPPEATVIDNGCGCRLGAWAGWPRFSVWWLLTGLAALRWRSRARSAATRYCSSSRST